MVPYGLSCTLVLLLILRAACATYTWPNHVMDELEHLLVDTEGFNDGGFRNAITPCTNYVSGSQLLGRETAAQWIRVAFHDFATADVAAGTGGIDASIGFETLRAENSGSAMNDSLAFFAPFVNAHVSMADMIALSVVMSVGGCSSPSIHIPLRGGRNDATEAGEFGVPEPETDIEETLDQFKKAGFNQEDAIALTACGHTMGSVHHGGFPQVVPESAVTPNNTGGGIHFDATPAVFDIDVVNEYLTWSGQKGGPLVTTDNITVRSDLRIFTSDNNATLQRLSASTPYFISSCVSLFSRMIDTVPSTTTLTDIIVPNEVKPINISLDLDADGSVVFRGYIRLLSTVFQADSTVTISWISRDGDSSSRFLANGTLLDTGSGIFGTTYYHAFSAPIDPTAGISAFFITVHNGPTIRSFDNGGRGYPLQDIVIWLPGQSQVHSDKALITAAVLTSASTNNVTAVFSIPSPQDGTLSPQILRYSLPLSPSNKTGDYTLYTGVAERGFDQGGQTTLDVIANTNKGLVTDEFRRLTTAS